MFVILFVIMLIYWFGAVFFGIFYFLVLGFIGMAIVNFCIVILLGVCWLEVGYFFISNLYEFLFFLIWGIIIIYFIVENMSGFCLVGVFIFLVVMGIFVFAVLILFFNM